MSWHDLFVISVPVLEKIIRPVLVYVFLVICLRLAGKRELAQLNPFDLIVLLLLANTVQNAMIGNDMTITGGLISALSLLVANTLLVRLLYRHPHLDRVIEGSPDYLIRDGHVIKDHLNRELMTRAELLAAAHAQSIRSLAEVQSAVLEPTGTISFVAKSPSAETARHLELLDRIDRLTAELAAMRSPR